MMDHDLARTTKASERYLLGEMNEPERDEFEEHYFLCATCAEDVRTGEVLARAIKAIGPSLATEGTRARGWGNWFSFASLAPMAAAIGMTAIAGYQALVLIPGLRRTLEPQATTPVVLRAATRGEEPVITVPGKDGITLLALDVNSGEPGDRIDWELTPPGGEGKISGQAKAPPAGMQLELWLPNNRLRKAGAWTLNLRNAQGGDAGSYPFQVKTE